MSEAEPNLLEGLDLEYEYTVDEMEEWSEDVFILYQTTKISIAAKQEKDRLSYHFDKIKEATVEGDGMKLMIHCIHAGYTTEETTELIDSINRPKACKTITAGIYISGSIVEINL